MNYSIIVSFQVSLAALESMVDILSHAHFNVSFDYLLPVLLKCQVAKALELTVVDKANQLPLVAMPAFELPSSLAVQRLAIRAENIGFQLQVDHLFILLGLIPNLNTFSMSLTKLAPARNSGSLLKQMIQENKLLPAMEDFELFCFYNSTGCIKLSFLEYLIQLPNIKRISTYNIFELGAFDRDGIEEKCQANKMYLCKKK